jgi:UDPglucose 6-dehydrogenase
MFQSINIIGYGFVGSAIGYLCKQNNVKFNVCELNDKVDDYQFITKDIKTLVEYSEAQNELNHYIIAVPTPSNDDYMPNMTYVEDVLQQLNKYATKKSYAIIKSTLCPTTSQKFCNMFSNLEIILCPEFLKEATYEKDIYNAQFVLLGVSKDKIYKHLCYDDVICMFKALYAHNYQIPIYVKSYEQCELFKYTLNVFFAVKIWYFNEIYEVSQRIGVDYDHLQKMFYLDSRIGDYGTYVPGHDGKFGYGLSCLPKETKGMACLQEALGIDNTILKEIIKRNDEFRNKPTQ